MTIIEYFENTDMDKTNNYNEINAVITQIHSTANTINENDYSFGLVNNLTDLEYILNHNLSGKKMVKTLIWKFKSTDDASKSYLEICNYTGIAFNDNNVGQYFYLIIFYIKRPVLL